MVLLYSKGNRMLGNVRVPDSTRRQQFSFCVFDSFSFLVSPLDMARLNPAYTPGG